MLIGAGGVAGVAAAKMAQNPETFGELLIASRTEARCKAIKADVESRYAAGNGKWGTGNGSRTKITTAQIDAMDVPRLVALIREYKPDLVMNIALPYQDLAIMDACLEAGVSYLDTANYEPPDEAHFEYSWQWAYRERFEKAGLTAILGCGFDPGVTQVFSAYAQKHYFDTIETLDILDCNGGDHGYPFATNFNPEINIREVAAKGSYWVADEWGTGNGEQGTCPPSEASRRRRCPSRGGNGERISRAKRVAEGDALAGVGTVDSHGVPVEYKKAFDKGWWVETAPMAIKRVYNFDQVGEKDMYLLHHEELESLGCNLKGIKRIRFFMTFGQSYLTHLKCLENVGMTRIDPVDFKGQKIVPIEFLKALLPDPATLGPRTKGKTNIGCIFHGLKDGRPVDYYVYNVCDHQECYAEVGSQAISYTTGVPAMIGAKMFLEGKWTEKGVHTCEEFDPDPFMAELNVQGLPWTENFNPVKVD